MDAESRRAAILARLQAEASPVSASALASGDVVLCVVCERDISKARSGIMAVPTIRHHDLSDSVVVGVL